MAEVVDPRSVAPVFVEEPQDAFVIRSDPAELTCAVRAATQAHFKCNGKWLGRTSAKYADEHDEQTGESLIRVTVQITRMEIDSFFARFSYWCQCVAWSSAGQRKSRKATVQLAYLRRNFKREPTGGSAVIGSQFKLQCSPPAGQPTPKVEWLKNGEPILLPDENSNLFPTHAGDLILKTRRAEDGGNYTCVASNVAGERRSHTAVVRVGVNGDWSEWSQWSGCASRCGIGETRRVRSCTEPSPRHGGLECAGDAVQTRTCTKLCPVNGGWTGWSRWSACSPDCVHRRRRTCTQPRPYNSGMTCPGKHIEARKCSDGLCTARVEASRESLDFSSNPSVVLYGCMTIALAILVFVIVATVLLLRKKKTFRRPSSSAGRARPARRAVVAYSSSPFGGEKLADEFRMVAATSQPPAYHAARAATTKEETTPSSRFAPVKAYYEPPVAAMLPSYYAENSALFGGCECRCVGGEADALLDRATDDRAPSSLSKVDGGRARDVPKCFASDDGIIRQPLADRTTSSMTSSALTSRDDRCHEYDSGFEGGKRATSPYADC